MQANQFSDSQDKKRSRPEEDEEQVRPSQEGIDMPALRERIMPYRQQQWDGFVDDLFDWVKSRPDASIEVAREEPLPEPVTEEPVTKIAEEPATEDPATQEPATKKADPKITFYHAFTWDELVSCYMDEADDYTVIEQFETNTERILATWRRTGVLPVPATAPIVPPDHEDADFIKELAMDLIPEYIGRLTEMSFYTD